MVDDTRNMFFFFLMTLLIIICSFFSGKQWVFQMFFLCLPCTLVNFYQFFTSSTDFSIGGSLGIKRVYKPAIWCLISTTHKNTHRIHGAGIYANIKGVYWWDPCYHIYIYIYSIHGSYGIWWLGDGLWHCVDRIKQEMYCEVWTDLLETAMKCVWTMFFPVRRDCLFQLPHESWDLSLHMEDNWWSLEHGNFLMFSTLVLWCLMVLWNFYGYYLISGEILFSVSNHITIEVS